MPADLMMLLLIALPSALAGAWAGSAIVKRRLESDRGAIDRRGDQTAARVNELEADRARMAAILSGMVEGVLVVDGDGRLRLVNEAARHMLNLEDDLLGRHYVEAVRQPGVVQQLGAALKGEHRPPIEVPLDRGSGATDGPRIFRAQATPASAEGGGLSSCSTTSAISGESIAYGATSSRMSRMSCGRRSPPCGDTSKL